MPIYEYQCRSCGRRNEVVQAMSDLPLTTCTSCQGEIYRIISAPGLSFKGEGWYITDYARKGKETDTTKKVDEKSDKKEAPLPTTGEKKAEPSLASTPPSPPSPPSSPGPSQPDKK